MLPIRNKIMWFIKSLLVSFLPAIPFSYFLIIHYLNAGSSQETILVMITVGFLLGITLRDEKLFLITNLLGLIFAILVATYVIAYSIFLPFIKVTTASFLLTIYFTAASLISKTFIIIFFFILPSILLSGIFGVFLSRGMRA